MIFEIEPSSNPRGRNKNTIVLMALLPDPLGNNPSAAAIERYAEGVERALARVAPAGNAGRRRGRFAGDFLLGCLSPPLPQRSRKGARACKQQAKYKRGCVAAQRAARPSTGRSRARAVPK